MAPKVSNFINHSNFILKSTNLHTFKLELGEIFIESTLRLRLIKSLARVKMQR